MATAVRHDHGHRREAPASPASGRDTPALHRIGELAARVGMTERTIRYYEERGITDAPKRLEGGARVYSDDDARRLRFVQRLKALGLTLEEIYELAQLYRRDGSNRSMLPRLIELLDAHLATISERITELATLRDEIRAYRERTAQRLLAEDA